MGARWFAAAVAAMAAGCATTALCQDNQIRRGPEPAWATPSPLMAVPADPRGLVFVRRQDVAIHIDAKGQEQYTGYRIRILNPNALQLGNIGITWNPAAGSPVVHAVRVYRGTDVIDVLKTASFDVVRREDQLEASKLTGNLTAMLRVPDLRVGDEIETSITVPSDDPTLGNKVAGLLVLNPSPPPGRYGMSLSWDAGLAPTIKPSKDTAARLERGDRMIRLAYDDPAVATPPKDAPPRFTWQRVVDYSRFRDWASISRLFAPLYRTAATLDRSSPLRAEANRIMAANPAPLARAAAALKLVQQDVRYVYIGLNGGNLKPASADETWQRRYGDCKGKTVLLLALLKEMGIEAAPVLVNTAGIDDGLGERLPNPGLFDHVLIRAMIGGRAYWLDGTLPAVVPPSAEPFLPYRTVLPLTTDGSDLVALPWQPLSRPAELTVLDLDARAGFGQPTKVVNTTIVRGIKGLEQQVQWSALTPDQMLAGFRQQAIGDTWRSIDSVDWHYDVPNAASVLTIKGTWVLDWTDDGNGAKSYALPGGGFSPPDRLGRSTDQDQSIPYANKRGYNCSVTTLQLPAGTKPSQWYTKDEYDNHLYGHEYFRAFQIKGDSIRMIRGSRDETPEVDAETATADNARLPKFDNSMAWVNFDPKGNYKTAVRKSDVPTALDHDWLANDIACSGSLSSGYPVKIAAM
jgi:transglutaminase-like putative cysteine protease